jgi:hypothetical protein
VETAPGRYSAGSQAAQGSSGREGAGPVGLACAALAVRVKDRLGGGWLKDLADLKDLAAG